MKNLFTTNDTTEILLRLEHLEPDTQALWGKMTVAQMLAHCAEGLKMGTGKIHPPRIFIGRILSPFIKKNFFNEKPFNKNSPTDSRLIITGAREFEIEKQNVITLIHEFYDGGKEHCTKFPHFFFGKLTPEQWSIGMFKHLDHHLRQFGV